MPLSLLIRNNIDAEACAYLYTAGLIAPMDHDWGQVSHNKGSFFEHSDEKFNRGIFAALTEAKILIEKWRKEYNQV